MLIIFRICRYQSKTLPLTPSLSLSMRPRIINSTAWTPCKDNGHPKQYSVTKAHPIIQPPPPRENLQAITFMSLVQDKRIFPTKAIRDECFVNRMMRAMRKRRSMRRLWNNSTCFSCGSARRIKYGTTAIASTNVIALLRNFRRFGAAAKLKMSSRRKNVLRRSSSEVQGFLKSVVSFEVVVCRHEETTDNTTATIENTEKY